MLHNWNLRFINSDVIKNMSPFIFDSFSRFSDVINFTGYISGQQHSNFQLWIREKCSLFLSEKKKNLNEIQGYSACDAIEILNNVTFDFLTTISNVNSYL